jgi:putative restriction endonuclease
MNMVNQFERAYKTWPILVRHAADRKTITYGALANKIGLKHHRPIRFVLEIIQDYCIEENLPPLTILAVSQTGNRGSGFIAWGRDNLDEGEIQVFSFPWRNIKNPFSFASDGINSLKGLSRNLISNPDIAEDVYAKVKVRGVAQQIFRRSILKAYGGKCAFSGIPIKETLEAVHIVPWSKCEKEFRIHVGNGILLSSLHHKLFDKGLISINENYVISVSEKLLVKQDISKTMSVLIGELNGKLMWLPKNKENWPLIEMIRLRNRLNKKKTA